jgi:hypothetical protein
MTEEESQGAHLTRNYSEVKVAINDQLYRHQVIAHL